MMNMTHVHDRASAIASYVMWVVLTVIGILLISRFTALNREYQSQRRVIDLDEARFSAILREMKYPLIFCQEDGTIIKANRAARVWLGNDIVGRNCDVLVASESLDAHHKGVKDTATMLKSTDATEHSFSKDVTMVVKGERIPVFMDIVAIESHNVVEFIAFIKPSDLSMQFKDEKGNVVFQLR